jgi:hypothetical protein
MGSLTGGASNLTSELPPAGGRFMLHFEEARMLVRFVVQSVTLEAWEIF